MALQTCREVLEAWGLAPAELEATVAAELREERRKARAINRLRLGLGRRRAR